MDTTGTGSASELNTYGATGLHPDFLMTRMWVERPAFGKRLRREGALLALASIVLGLSFASSALKSRGLWVGIPCVFNKLTHLPCLTCGLTRSFAQTAHGNISGALEYHLLGPALFFLVFALAAYLLVALCTGRRLRFHLAPRMRKAASWSVLAVFVVSWVLKVSFMKVTW